MLAVTSEKSLRLLEDFPEYLAGRGWDVHVVAASAGPDPCPTPGVTRHALPMVRDPSPLNDLMSLARWIRLLARLKADIVVSGTPKAGLLGMLAGFIARVPTRVYLLRGLRLETANGWSLRFMSVLEWVTSRCAHHVIAVSPSLRREYVRRGLVSPERISVVGDGSSNGVRLDSDPDPQAVDALIRELDVRPGESVIGFVGRITADKGLPDLLRAVNTLGLEGLRVRLLVVGSEEPSGALEHMCAETGIDPSLVTWVGQVEDPSPYYRLMTVLCLPSSREGFPNVVLEAASLGIPAVVSSATGAVDSVIDGQTGLVYQKDLVASLCSRLRSVVEDPSLASTLGAEAREFVAMRFRRETVWQNYEATYRRLMSRRRLRRYRRGPHDSR